MKKLCGLQLTKKSKVSNIEHPASNPEWGPNRLSVERVEYDKTDWPGSSSFQPPHLRKLGDEMLEQTQKFKDEVPETTDSNSLGRLGTSGYYRVIPSKES